MSEPAHEPRVLHVDDQSGWRGGEQQMVYLAEGLRRRSIRTALVLQKGGLAVQKAREAGLPVHEVRMRGEADLAAAFRIARLTRKGRFNILHSHTSHAHMLIALAAGLFRAPARVVVHRRIEFPVGRSGLGLGGLKYRFGVDAYIAISNRVKETLMEAGVPEWRIFPVRSATDPQRFIEAASDPGLRASLGIPEGAFVVGNIGALVGHKDHSTLLEAGRTVRDAIPDTWLVIVGDGPLREHIHSAARKLRMSDRLVMTGFRWDIPQLIRIFDVFALSSSEEGMCSTLLEVAAAGCPIVATDAGGVREAVLPGETGIVVPIKDARALANGILELTRDPGRGRMMAERGRERVVRQFNAHVLTERTLEVYSRVLGGQVGPEHPVGFLTD
jgi:glycosyltransferase involved in cell wall biosynthesis